MTPIPQWGFTSVGSGLADHHLSHQVMVGKGSQQIRIATVSDANSLPSRGTNGRAAGVERPEADVVLTGGQLEAIHLNLVGQEAPATRIGGFGRLPGEAGEVEG